MERFWKLEPSHFPTLIQIKNNITIHHKNKTKNNENYTTRAIRFSFKFIFSIRKAINKNNKAKKTKKQLNKKIIHKKILSKILLTT